ncbi:hypothetical protein SAMD00024442_13_9 [Candidatus Symbiothrix dinenymphae]|nr:hypothetical protein SAMD00024442_13_9 [Candidatus Symbiothrix dinenymphae]
MKRICFFGWFLFAFASVAGQTTNTEYFVSSSYTRTNLNPALRPARGYVGIPGVSNILVDYKTNAFNLENFIFPGKGENGKAVTFLHPDISAGEFLKNISANNYLALDFNLTVLGFGFYVGDAFVSFDLSPRIISNFNVPKGLFSFIKEVGGNHDFKNMSMTMAAIAQAGVGFSYPVLNKSLVLGGKVKVLAGLGAAGFNIDRLQLNFGEDRWTMRSQTTIQMYAPGVEFKYKADGTFDNNIKMDNFKPELSGFGLGFDLGATFQPGKYFVDVFKDNYEFLNNFTVSAAVTDIGYINWNKKNLQAVGTVDSEEITILGDGQFDFQNEENKIEDVFTDVTDKIIDAMQLKEVENPTQMRGIGLTAKMNWGLDYAFPNFPANLGFFTSTRFTPVETLTDFTFGGAIRPIRNLTWVELGLSYSLLTGGMANFEQFGVSLHLGNFFFISSDYLIPKVNKDFLPVSIKGLNVQLGLSIPLGGPRSRRQSAPQSEQPEDLSLPHRPGTERRWIPATTTPAQPATQAPPQVVQPPTQVTGNPNRE